jgi:hypothetical protein
VVIPFPGGFMSEQRVDHLAVCPMDPTAAMKSLAPTEVPLEAARFKMQFSGRAITLTTASSGGLARKITATFNEGFTACEAQIVFAKRASVEVVVGRSLTSEPQEVGSATVSGASCSVRDGNVFAQ